MNLIKELIKETLTFEAQETIKFENDILRKNVRYLRKRWRGDVSLEKHLLFYGKVKPFLKNKIVKCLGSGHSGTAYEMDNGNVVKLSTGIAPEALVLVKKRLNNLHSNNSSINDLMIYDYGIIQGEGVFGADAF